MSFMRRYIAPLPWDRPDVSLSTTLARLSALSGLAGIVLGVLVLAAWVRFQNVPAPPDDGMMRPWTAICFILLGLSLTLLRDPPTRRVRASWRGPHTLPAAAVVLIAALTLTQYLSGRDFGLDGALFSETMRAHSSRYPGRIASVSALALGLLGIAMLTMNARRAIVSQQLAAVAMLPMTFSLAGYLFGATALYDHAVAGSIALPTTLGALVLGAGIFAAQPRRGAMYFITRDTAFRGPLLRLWLASLGLILLFALLMQVVYAHLAPDVRTALAVGLVGTAVIVTVLTGWSATSLQRLESSRQVASDASEQHQDRLSSLYGVTSALSRATTVEAMLRAVVEEGAHVLGASAGLAGLVSADGASLEIIHAAGHPPDALAKRAALPMDLRLPVTEVARAGEAMFVESAQREHERSSGPATLDSRGQAWAVLPVRTREGVMGVLEFTFAAPRSFSADDRAFLAALADQCAQALARARLHETERAARAAAERHADKVQRLQLVIARLTGALTPEQVAEIIVAEGARALGRAAPLRGSESPAFELHDLDTAAKLAAFVGLALDNARLFRDTQDLNAQLERRIAQRTAQLLRSNDRLRQSRAEIRALSRQTLALIEQERKAVVSRVHDELSQTLIAAKMTLAFAEQSIAIDADRACEDLQSVRAALDSTIVSLRAMAADLRPVVLDDLGLAAAIEWHIGEVRQRAAIRTEFDDRFSDAQTDARLSMEASTAAFRIMQEVVKTAVDDDHASFIGIHLERNRTWLKMLIRQDGAVAASAQAGARARLFGLRERALQLGGALDASSIPGVGATVVVWLPLTEAPDPGESSSSLTG